MALPHQRGSRQRDRLERRQLPGQRELYYDHARGNLIEPVYYLNQKTGLPDGVGVGILPKASAAFGNPAAKYTAVHVATTTAYSHWPALTIDSKGNYYLVWDTDARDPDSTNGCPASDSGSESFGSLPPQNANTPLANKVLMSVSTDGGRTLSSPKTVAYSPGHRLLWPWITAGSAGNVGVVWYQYDRVTDPDCGTGNVSVMAARISGATTGHPNETAVDAVGRPIQDNGQSLTGLRCR